MWLKLLTDYSKVLGAKKKISRSTKSWLLDFFSPISVFSMPPHDVTFYVTASIQIKSYDVSLKNIQVS